MDLQKIEELSKEIQAIEKKINKETGKYKDKIELLQLKKKKKMEELRNYKVK